MDYIIKDNNEYEDLTPERFLDLIEAKKYSEIKGIISKMSAPDIAELFSEIDESYLILMFRLLPKEIAAETFVEMETELQRRLIEAFGLLRVNIKESDQLTRTEVLLSE